MGNFEESLAQEKQRRQEERERLKELHAGCAVCLAVGNTWETDRYAGHRPVPYTEDGNVCTGCGEFKPWIEYNPDKRSPMGRLKRCRVCLYRQKYGMEPRAGAQGPPPRKSRR